MLRIRWYGQSAFLLSGREHSVFIDPFHETAKMRARGLQFDYPEIEGVHADLLLITHEHGDHNGQAAIVGPTTVLRSQAGTFDTPYGKVIGVNSDHDEQGGTRRGGNIIFNFELDGVRVCHFGDFGQVALRPEQRAAIGQVDLLFLPVGAGPTIGPVRAREIAELLGARWIVPMHYRTEALGFLDPVDPFLALYAGVSLLPEPEADLDVTTDAGVLVFPAPRA